MSLFIIYLIFVMTTATVTCKTTRSLFLFYTTPYTPYTQLCTSRFATSIIKIVQYFVGVCQGVPSTDRLTN